VQRPVRRLRTLALIVLGSCLFACLGYGAALTRASSADSDRPPPDEPVTAAVALRQIQSSVITRGDAGFSDPVRVALHITAPVPVVTATPIRAGDRIEAGQVLVEVAGRPVILLPGRFPAYRDLAAGDVGPDVEQLERALVDLGYDPGEVDDQYTAATARAVASLYRDRGYPAPQAPAAADASSGADASKPGGSPSTTLPMSEVAYVPALPRRVDQQPDRVGSLLSAKPVLLSGATPQVTIGLTTADVGVLHQGMRAVVVLPSGRRVTGRLGEVRRTATGGTTTIRLPALARTARSSLADANVKVTVPLQASSGKVLVVPIAALNTDARGTVHVVRVGAGGSENTLEVQVGLAADGFAEVTSPGRRLAAGDRVVVGS
jgi:peptidoglycan hydrolase-like protein with peptidoglycan-binding domain